MPSIKVPTWVRAWWGWAVAAAGTLAAFLAGFKNILEVLTGAAHTVAEVWDRWGAWQFAIVLVILVVTLALLALVWAREIAEPIRALGRRLPRKLFAKVIASLGILAGVAGGVTVVLLYDPVPEQLIRLLPQAKQVLAVAIRTYGTNGKASYEMMSGAGGLDPTSFARITFNPYGAAVEQNCGWMIFFVRGTSLARFKEFRFLIRGSAGQEKIGLKAKDASGTEVAVRLDDSRQIASGKIERTWQEVTIPFRRFGNVDFTFFDNLSLYVSGEMAGPGPQTIDVGAFEFR